MILCMSFTVKIFTLFGGALLQKEAWCNQTVIAHVCLSSDFPGASYKPTNLTSTKVKVIPIFSTGQCGLVGNISSHTIELNEKYWKTMPILRPSASSIGLGPFWQWSPLGGKSTAICRRKSSVKLFAFENGGGPRTTPWVNGPEDYQCFVWFKCVNDRFT